MLSERRKTSRGLREGSAGDFLVTKVKERIGVSGKVRQLLHLGGILDLFPISASREDGIDPVR